ncbi:MAG: protease modulator HflK, partial [Methylophilaceae bacterium]|nr:protease modulator HflK [Methylophilaceae bacterium]
IEQARAYEAKVVPIAEGQAKRVFQEAEAYAKQVVLAAEGETAEFLKLLPQYLQAPKVTAERMYIETMQSIMTANPKVFVDAKNAPNMYMPFIKPSKLDASPIVKLEQDWNEASTSGVTSTNDDNDTRARINALSRMGRTS